MPYVLLVEGTDKIVPYSSNEEALTRLQTTMVKTLRKDAGPVVTELTDGWIRNGVVNRRLLEDESQLDTDWPQDVQAVYLMCHWLRKGVMYAPGHVKIIADFFRGSPYPSDDGEQDAWDKLGDTFKRGAEANCKVRAAKT